MKPTHTRSLCMCRTRRRQNKPSNTQEPEQQSTQQRATERSCANLTKPSLLQHDRVHVCGTCRLHHWCPPGCFNMTAFVLHGESPTRLAPRRNTKTRKHPYNIPKRPSTGTTHRPSTRHYRKASPRPHLWYGQSYLDGCMLAALCIACCLVLVDRT